MSEKKIVEENEVQDRIFVEKLEREAAMGDLCIYDTYYCTGCRRCLNDEEDLEAEANSNYMKEVL